MIFSIYLGKESNNADPESSGADVVSTSEKSDDYMKSNRTNESKENSNVASSSFSQSSPKPESIKKEKYNEQRATPGIEFQVIFLLINYNVNYMINDILHRIIDCRRLDC